MSISIETYFWLLDRLKIEDDSRNKVNMTKNQVTLSKPFLKKCENGLYLGQLLNEIYPTYSSRVDKQFTIPQAVTEINAETPSFSQPVWKNIFEGLAMYGCKIEPAKQDQILKTARTDQVIELFDCLFEIDNSPNGQISAATKRKVGIKGNQAAKPPRNNDSTSELDQDIPGRNIKGLGSLTDRKGSAAMTRGKKLAPLQDNTSPTKQQNYASPDRAGSMKKSPSTGALVLSPNGKTPSRILGKEASLLVDLGVDQLESVMPTTLEACKTSFQFILVSLSISFEMKPKQAAALLTNNNKYLTHLCVKGAKGGEFQNVLRWYELISPYASFLVSLVATEKKDIMSILTPLLPISSKVGDAKENRGKVIVKTFNILKGGLYSRNQDVQLACGQFFASLFTEINDKIPDMSSDITEWLTATTVQPEFKRQKSIKTGKSRDESSKLSIGSHLVGTAKNGKNKQSDEDSEMKLAIGSKELEVFQFQTGIQAILYAYVSNDEFIDIAVDLMLQAGRITAQQFFTHQLITQVPTWSLYGNICCDIFRKSLGTELASNVIQDSGVLHFWIVQSLKIAESNSEVPLNDRIVSLVFMTEIWLARPQFFTKVLNNAPDAIMRILKKGARDVRRTLCVISIELMFRLLLNFASERHSYAPTIYKTLTFLLVEFYWEIDVRELMLRHFFDLFASFDSIPINILCEPLFKQIGISQYHETSFNVFDFEFFTIVAQHSKLNISTALQLIDSLSKIALTSVYYQAYSISIINSLMQRFNGYPEMIDHWKDSFRQILSTIVNMEARFAVHRHHLRQEENNFFNRLALRGKKAKVEVDPSGGRMSDQEYLLVKTNMRLTINLIEKVMNIQNQQINKDLKIQLMDTYIGIQSGLKVDCKGIAYLLKFFSNKVDAMIEERQLSHPQAAQQVAIPFVQELNQLQNGASSSPRRGGEGSPGGLLQRKLSNPKMPPPALGAPVHHPDRQFQVSVALPLNQGEKKRHSETVSHLYDYLKWEEEWEINQYKQFLRRHHKLYKQLHKSYINENAVKKPLAIARTTFEENEKTIDQITASSLIKLIKDFRLENGVNPTILKEEVIKLVKQINIHILKQPGDVQTLNFDGFVNFMLQYAHIQWQTETQHKAYQVIEKLINQLMESPMYQKLGLVTNKVETTNRKEVQVLQAIEERLKADDDYQNQNFKVKEDQVTTVEYIVPPSVPISESTRVVVELLDEIFFKGLGVHFLEPVTVSNTIRKVIPQLISRRKVSVQPISVQNKNRGISSNLPLSQQISLSADQEEAQLKFLQEREMKQLEKGIRNQERQQSVGNSNYGVDIDQKERFKSQAIDRRASKFGPVMQMQIIDADNYFDKQNMFECASVLDEVLKAVEKGKKALRLDFTPYKLYELRKKKVTEQQPKVTEQIIEEDPEVKQRKQEAVSQFLARHGAYIDQQKQVKASEEELKQKELQKKERLKRKIVEEYQIAAEETKINAYPKRQEKQLQKLEEKERALAEKEQRKLEAQEKVKEYSKKYKRELQDLEAETQGQKHADERKEERAKVQMKQIADQWSKIHKEKRVQIEQSKQQYRDNFYQFLSSPQIQQMLNQKYAKGLYVKYDQCQKMSQKTTGVSQSGWIEFLKQAGVVQKIDAKQLVNIHTSQAKEMKEMPEVGQVIQTDLKAADAMPGEKELNYQGFVIALVKVANLGKMSFRGEEIQEQPVREYLEYALDDFDEEDVRRFFKFIHVAAKK